MSDASAKKSGLDNSDWFSLLGKELALEVKKFDNLGEYVEGLESKRGRSIVSEGKDRNESIRAVQEHSAQHLVQQDGLAFQAELNSSAFLLNNEHLFYSFPVSAILDPNQVGIKREAELTIFERRFSNDTEKVELQLSLETELRNHIRSRSLLTEIVGVSDELITNVLYNAPHVSADNATSGINRNSRGVKLGKGKTGRLVCGIDESRVVVGCEDPYGALNVDAMLARVQRCYESGVADSMNTGPGGARIGMFLVVNSSTSFYAGVIPGKITSVFCVFPYKMGNKKRVLEPFNIHVFTSSEE